MPSGSLTEAESVCPDVGVPESDIDPSVLGLLLLSTSELHPVMAAAIAHRANALIFMMALFSRFFVLGKSLTCRVLLLLPMSIIFVTKIST